MILFYDDWDRYPTATIHKDTSNESFLRIAMLYRDMGIKNNAFPLALVDQDLRKINPFDENLSLEELGKITIESAINPWYFLREVLRAPPLGSSKGMPVEANRSVVSLWWLFFNHCTTFLIQPRQTGKSFITDALMTYLLTIHCQNTKINLLTKDDNLRRSNIDRIKSIINQLPYYLNPITNKDSNNGENITVLNRDNYYNTFVSRNDPRAAEKVMRGSTSGIVHIDESPFISHVGITLRSALPAVVKAQEICASNNAPYGVIFTTTAGRKNDRDGRVIYDIFKQSMTLDERLLYDAKDSKDLETIVRKHSNPDRSLFKEGIFQVAAVFSHRQLGKDDVWLRKALETSKSTGEDALRDYFNIWTSGTEQSPLSVEDAEQLALNRKDLEEAYLRIEDFSYAIRWYLQEDEIDSHLLNHPTILGLDTSEATGNDDIGLVITDVSSGAVLGAMNYNDTNVFKFSQFILSLLIKYPKLIAIIEAKSTGVGILNHLLYTLPQKNINPFKRLFNTVIQERDHTDLTKARYQEMIKRPLSEDLINKYRKCFGYKTSGQGDYSRDMLYGASVFRHAIRHTKTKIQDFILTNQILSLVIKNGRIDHDDFGHDDMVIAWLLSHYLLTQGKNLNYYGINPYNVLQDPENETVNEYQIQLREKIKEKTDKLKATSDFYLTLKLEQELRALEKDLVLQDNEILSIDHLIKEANQQKKRLKAKSNIPYYFRA